MTFQSLMPGATVGIIGGGQLGRMLAMAAARLGYRNRVGARSPSAPHSGGDAARLGKVRLRDELPNSGNHPCEAACRACHA